MAELFTSTRHGGGSVWSKVLSVVLVTAVIYLFFLSGFTNSIPTRIADDYPLGDEEVNYMTSLTMFRGGKWYEDFAIVYPPGRYILLSGLYHLVSPTFPTYHLYWRIVGLITPVVLFFFSRLVYRRMGGEVVLANAGAALATMTYLGLVRSMQEGHVFLMLFLMTLLSKKMESKRQYLAGILLGITYLLRLDLGIMATLAATMSYLTSQPRFPLKKIIMGSLTVWLPVLGVITVHGSIGNFFHDTLIVGLWHQPRQMSLPLPIHELWLVYWAGLVVLVSLLGSMIARAKGQKSELALKTVAGTGILLYAAVLGRSDEAHLWYGLAFLPLAVGYSLLCLKLFKFNLVALVASLMIVGWSYVMLKLKSPPLYLASALLLIYLCSRIPRKLLRGMAVWGLIFGLTIFHSLSYLELRLRLPHSPAREVLAYETFRNDPGETAGLELGPETVNMLKEVKRLTSGKTVFIYPDHTLYYEFLGQANPSRYFFMIGESSKLDEQELTRSAQTVDFILLFPRSGRSEGSPTEEWILANTAVEAEYNVGKMKVELRQKTQ